MKKILSLVLVLMLSLTFVAMAEPAADPTVDPSAEPTAKPVSPTAGPLPTDAPTTPPANDDDDDDDDETPDYVPTLEENLLLANALIEGVTYTPDTDDAVKALNEEAHDKKSDFGEKINAAVADKIFLGAKQGTFSFVDTSAAVELKQLAPAELKLSNGDKVTIVIGVVDAYGAYTFITVDGKVQTTDGQQYIVFTVDAATATAMNNKAATKVLFFKG